MRVPRSWSRTAVSVGRDDVVENDGLIRIQRQGELTGDSPFGRPLAAVRMESTVASPAAAPVVGAGLTGILRARRRVSRRRQARIRGRRAAVVVATVPVEAATAAAAATATLVEVRGLRHVVVHALPRGRVAATSHAGSGATTAVSLVKAAAPATAPAAPTLIEHLLLVVVVEALLASVALLAALALAASVGHHLLLHLLLHLLEHLRVHVRHGRRHLAVLGAALGTTTLAHLLLHLLHLLHLQHLHHRGVHAVHAHAAVHSHLLLHHAHVLLHPLQVLRHDLRRHAALAHLAGHLVLAAAALVLGAALAEFAAPLVLFLLAHVASRLRLLDLDRLAVDLEMGAQARIHAGLALEGDEPEAAGSAGVLVHHEGSVHDPAELGEVVLKLLLRGVLADAADEDLACLLLLISGYRSLGVDLHRRHDGINVVSTGKGKG